MISASVMAFAVLLLAIAAYFLGRGRALALSDGGAHLHSLPSQHGMYVALAAFLPAIAVVIIWAVADDFIVSGQVLSAMPASAQPKDAMERAAFVADIRGLAHGDYAEAFSPNARLGADLWRAAEARFSILFAVLAAALALVGTLWAISRLKPDFRARTRVESVVMIVLMAASLVAIFTTFGIVASLLFESLRFFKLVSPIDFLFGLRWSPEDGVYGSGSFGAVPLFWGTVFIGAIIAMLVALPLGLMSAIYLTQYAPRRFRRTAKPLLEILAGVPTVVYGFFAALVVAPAVRQFATSIGISNASSESALAAGLVMGVMIIPFVSSMADDALVAVPGAMRDGSLAMGATRSETIRKVLIPAALPGIVGGVLLAVSRAIGETMIVVMAAGLTAKLTANPFDSVTTVTAQIVSLLTGDQEFDSAKTLSAFALGLVLFLVTLALNVYALAVVKKYREAYD